MLYLLGRIIMHNINFRSKSAVMIVYRAPLHFPVLLHMLCAYHIFFNPLNIFSLHISIHTCMNVPLIIEHPRKRVLIGKNIHSDLTFLTTVLKWFSMVLLLSWFSIILLRSGDIQPNPGPCPAELNISCDSGSYLSSSNTTARNHISFVHYNIQSLVNKIDVLYTGLREFDIIAFTETWLNNSILSSELLFNGFHEPIRKDRPFDSHGGVAIYVNQNIPFKRRPDLELNQIECIWIELILKKKQINSIRSLL